MHYAGVELDPREPKCEAPECRTPGRRGAFVVFASKYPAKKHVLCSDCLEPMLERLAETKFTGTLEVEPLDPHTTRRPSIAFVPRNQG